MANDGALFPPIPKFDKTNPVLAAAWAWAESQAGLPWTEAPPVPDFWKAMGRKVVPVERSQLVDWIQAVEASRTAAQLAKASSPSSIAQVTGEGVESVPLTEGSTSAGGVVSGESERFFLRQ